MWQGLNLATNAFLRWSLGPEYSARLLAVMEMPKVETHLSLDFSSLLGPIFYCWLSQLLLPLFLVTLVYEKQCRSAQLALSVNLCQAVPSCVSSQCMLSSLSSCLHECKRAGVVQVAWCLSEHVVVSQW